MFRRDRNRNGGGVAIYCEEAFSAKRRPDLETDIEVIWIEIPIHGKSNLFGCCYRPPGQNIQTSNHFLAELQKSLESAIDQSPASITLVGDLNDRCTSWHSQHTQSELGNKLYNLINNLNLFQLIDEPTRENNILDLLISDSPVHFFDTGTIPPLSGFDHLPIYGKYNKFYSHSPAYKRVAWQYDLGNNYTALNNTLRDSLPIPGSTYDINQHTQHITDKIMDAMQQHIPHKQITIKNKNKPWYTSKVRIAYRDSFRAYKLQKRTKAQHHIDSYKEKHRIAKQAFRQARLDYYNNISTKLQDPSTTPKYFWKLVKTVYNNTKQSTIPVLLDNGIQHTNDLDKAEILNNYFISQTKLPASNTPLPTFTYLTHARLLNITITPTSVKNILKSLDTNKAVGPDLISNKILKECAESLSEPLSELFQKSLDEGIYPSAWKEALVSAIFKKIDRQIKTNYRPISLLSCISKVFEKLVFNDLYHFLIINKILTDINSGFRKNDSSINRLLAILEEIYQGLDNHKNSIFISLDISKAFDRVWHEGLLFKLRQCGVDGQLLKWFKSYLSDRSQRVVVGGSTSSQPFLHSGVPQGSLLGPLLFLVYVNNMGKGIRLLIHQFADDTNQLQVIEHPVEVVEILNHDLALLSR